jgi:succinate dehydrogenase/fumarate reductase flavoprotein subunit
VRDEGGIIEGLRKLHGLEQDLKGASWSNVIDRAMKEDLLSAVFSLKAILSASTGRKESRGSFIRKDFPREDNANWRKNSCLTYDAKKDSFSVTYHAVK